MNREARRILVGWSTHGAVTARTRMTTENRRKEKDTVGTKKEGSSRLGACTTMMLLSRRRSSLGQAISRDMFF